MEATARDKISTMVAATRRAVTGLSVLAVAAAACSPGYTSRLVNAASTASPDTPAYSATARAFAATEPATGPPGAPSDCDADEACATACEANEANACTRLADRTYRDQPARAEALWLRACRERDAAGCARLFQSVVHDLALSVRYGWHACVYGDADVCNHVAWAYQVAANAPRLGEHASDLRSAANRARVHAEQLRRTGPQTPTASLGSSQSPDTPPEVRGARRIAGRERIAPIDPSEILGARQWRLSLKVCISDLGTIGGVNVISP